MTAIIALLFKLVGVGFLFVAAIGVIRFSDAFQRMHAATKAGTLGAGLVVVGTIIGSSASGTLTMGVLTILFLLLTVPVAGHMLGRASYISGANMAGLKGTNALEGVLERQELSLEDRLSGISSAGDLAAIVTGAMPSGAERAEGGGWYGNLSEVKIGVVHGHVDTVFPRALAIARANRAHISAHVIVDEKAIETARDPQRTRHDIRERAAQAMKELEALKGKRRIKLNVVYEEGDPAALLASDGTPCTLLVVPRQGWFHHGNDDPRPATSWEPDGLLHLPQSHRGPVLYASGKQDQSGRIVLHDAGEAHLEKALDWALASSLWAAREVVVIGCKGDERKDAFKAVGARHEVEIRFDTRGESSEGLLPADLADADAIIRGKLPRPLRTRWYGQSWCDRMIPGFGGDVLIVCE